MPVSTTHVSSGAIFGTGLGSPRRGLRWKVVGEILIAWVITLPVSGLLGGVAYAVLG
jgi:PiT family inorganic phosphate transporter